MPYKLPVPNSIRTNLSDDTQYLHVASAASSTKQACLFVEESPELEDAINRAPGHGVRAKSKVSSRHDVTSSLHRVFLASPDAAVLRQQISATMSD